MWTLQSSGPGLGACRAATAAGARAVIIEGAPQGTTCARPGCMPSKLLIAAAEAAHGSQRWAEFGLRMAGRVAVDGQKRPLSGTTEAKPRRS